MQISLSINLCCVYMRDDDQRTVGGGRWPDVDDIDTHHCSNTCDYYGSTREQHRFSALSPTVPNQSKASDNRVVNDAMQRRNTFFLNGWRMKRGGGFSESVIFSPFRLITSNQMDISISFNQPASLSTYPQKRQFVVAYSRTPNQYDANHAEARATWTW